MIILTEIARLYMYTDKRISLQCDDQFFEETQFFFPRQQQYEREMSTDRVLLLLVTSNRSKFHFIDETGE